MVPRQKPPIDTYKFNTDSSAMHNPGRLEGKVF